VAWTNPGFEFREGRIFLSLPKRTIILWESHSVLVGTFWPSLVIKRSRRGPNNSPVSSVQVMTHNTQDPLMLTFEVKLKVDLEGCAGVCN